MKRFLVWKKANSEKDFTQIFDEYFTGAFDNRGRGIWTVLKDRAAHYEEASACLLAKSLGACIREVKE